MTADDLINTKLLMQPMNWLIVWTVLLAAGFAFTYLHERLAAVPSPTPT